MTPWEIESDEFVSCNCAYGCPCQFNALPTQGYCEAVAGFRIGKGHFGEVKLDGLNVVCVFQWPGAIHEGGGKGYMIIDERAAGPQRVALATIVSGGETDTGKTMWNVFRSTLADAPETLFKTVELEIDVEGRLGHMEVDGLVKSRGEPIHNPVTGAEHRARIELPQGFEYTVAEVGSSSSTATGPIAMSFENRYAQFAHIHLNNHGVVRNAA